MLYLFFFSVVLNLFKANPFKLNRQVNFLLFVYYTITINEQNITFFNWNFLKKKFYEKFIIHIFTVSISIASRFLINWTGKIRGGVVAHANSFRAHVWDAEHWNGVEVDHSHFSSQLCRLKSLALLLTGRKFFSKRFGL